MSRAASAIPLVLVVAVGLAGSLVALSGRGANADFLFRQEHPPTLQPAAVERVVKTAPNPVGRRPGVSARCRPGSARGLRNPWACSVLYRSGHRERLRVQVRADASYVGIYASNPARARGCCIAIPGQE